MFKVFSRSGIAVATVFSVIGFADVSDAVAEDSGSPGFFSKLFGAVTSGAYKHTPEFRKYVGPYIRDMNAFDVFMDQYNYKKNLSDKDSIDIIIKLGIVNYQPSWLNKRAISLINNYYPGLLKRRAEQKDLGFRYARNCEQKIAQDYGGCDYEVAQVQVAPLVIMTAVTFQMVSYLTLNGLSKANTLENLNPDIQKALESTEADFCRLLGGCDHTTVEMAKGGDQNKDNEYSRDARNQPDPCRYLDELYRAERNSAERLKIILAQKFLGCRRNSTK